jgi:hypothetical protein
MTKPTCRYIYFLALVMLALPLSADLIPVSVLLSYSSEPCNQSQRNENRWHEFELLRFRDLTGDADTAYKKKMLDCNLSANASQCAKAAADELRRKLIEIEKLKLDEENRHNKQIDRLKTLCKWGIR